MRKQLITPAELLDWAVQNDIHPSVLGFLTAFGPLHPTGWAFAGEEGWQRVSDALGDEKLSEAEVRATVVDALGEDGASQFMQYHELVDVLPSFDDIASGRVTTLDPRINPAKAGYGVVIHLAHEVVERLRKIMRDWGSIYRNTDAYREWQSGCERVTAFVGGNFPAEFVVLYLRCSVMGVRDRGEETAANDLVMRPAVLTVMDGFRDLIMGLEGRT